MSSIMRRRRGLIGVAVLRTLMESSCLKARVFDNTILTDRTLPSPLGDTA